MKIPKHLARRGMSADQKKRVAAFVKECRKVLSKAPAFDTTDEAIEEAVQMAKKEEHSFPSVWKEPQDIGNKHTVVRRRRTPATPRKSMSRRSSTWRKASTETAPTKSRK